MTHAVSDLVALARRLVSIPSVTGGEGALADFLAIHLKRLGFRVREQKVKGRRRNILASSGPAPRVLLCTHQDTVPPFFPFSEDARYIYGRGACDAKGIMAAMIQAAAGLPREARQACGLLFLVGEETDSLGARKAGDLGLEPEFIVVGEPTGNKLGLAHKGYLSLRISVRGKKAHSGYPEKGRSAVRGLIDVLRRLERLDLGRDRTLGPSTLNIGRIEGGVAPNVVPDRARAEISVRAARPTREILGRIKAVVGGKALVETLSASEPQRLAAVPGFRTAVLAFSTDIPYLAGVGRPLLLGPGSILDAHTDAERLSKLQMARAVGLYRRLVGRLLGTRGRGAGHD
jgi:acetylornithine deacetylase